MKGWTSSPGFFSQIWDNKNINRKQGLDDKRKSPEDLNPEKKLEIKEAAEGLKEGLQKSDTNTKIVAQTITQNTKTKER